MARVSLPRAVRPFAISVGLGDRCSKSRYALSMKLVFTEVTSALSVELVLRQTAAASARSAAILFILDSPSARCRPFSLERRLCPARAHYAYGVRSTPGTTETY